MNGGRVEHVGGQRIAGVPEHVVVRQLYLGCLSQASYLVGDANTGRAIAVDPRRDVGEMLDAAHDEGLTIEMVVETHFHADFLSGHLELAAATGAEIGIGAAGRTDFASRGLIDGDIIDLGGVQIEVMSTPGHTPESISLVVRPTPATDPVAVLTGDTLFIGDVGRPDLLAAVDVPAEIPRQAAVPVGAASARAARRGVGAAGARSGLGMRQGVVDRDGVDDRGAAPFELRPPADDERGLCRSRHRRPAVGAGVLRV